MSKKAPFMRKNKFGLGLMALSALLFCAGVIFAMMSGYGWLLTQFTQPLAALISAGFILGLALLSSLTGFLLIKKQPAPAMQQDEMLQIIDAVTELLGEELTDPIKENPKTAILLASVAGFAAADHLH